MKIELLSKNHDRKGFDCNNKELNIFLQQTARQHIKKGISRTFVLLDDKTQNITGFFSLTACEICSDRLPAKYAKKYPAIVPGIKLARLAVSKEKQGKGMGTKLMVNAIKRSIIISEQLGIIGLFVDAKNEDARKFYQKFGFISMVDNSLDLFLPISTLQKAYEIAKRI